MKAVAKHVPCRDWLHWRPAAGLVDGVLAVALMGGIVAVVIGERLDYGRLVSTQVGLVALAVVPMWWRRKYQPAAFVSTFAVVAFAALVLADETAMPVLFVALYACARYSSPRCSGFAVAGVSMVAMASQLVGAEPLVAVLISGALALVPWLLGERARLRAERRVALYEQIDELEFDRDRRAREAVVEERLRFARELHDVVSHSLSAVTLHAGGARTSPVEMSPDVRHMFATIEHTARANLSDIRQLLHALRSDSDDVVMGPSVHLCDIAKLAHRHRLDGFDVQVGYRGNQRELSPNVELAGHRIIHEALFNARRHGGASSAIVTISFSDSFVSIVVADNGIDKAAPASGGLGLIGMRERLELLDGAFSAGWTANGWEVRATIPLRRDPSPTAHE